MTRPCPANAARTSLRRALTVTVAVFATVAFVASFLVENDAFAQSAPAAGGKPKKRRAKKMQGVPADAQAAAPPDLTGKLPPVELPTPIERSATDCPDKIPAGKRFKWDLRGEVELKDLVNWVSSALCKPVIVPSNVRQQKVQITAPGLVTQPEAYRMFLAALTSMGLTIQPEGTAMVLIETNRARQSPVPFIGPDGRVPDNAQYITKVMRLDHISTEDVNNVLTRLKSNDGEIIAYAPTNTLILTDTSENVRRMDEIVHLLDQPMSGEKIWVVKLRNTESREMAGLLEKIFQPKGKEGKSGRGPNLANPSQPQQPGAAQGSETQGSGGDLAVSLIIPVEKQNMLIIISNERTYQRVLALVKRLEQSSAAPVDQASDRIHVYPLANATAEDMATTLSGLGVGISASGKGKTGAPTSAAGGAAAQQAAAGGLFESEVRVASDKPTNSLVIVASGKDYYVLRDIIKKLDITRRQVYIEATILEISLDKSRKLGAGFHAGTNVDTGGQQSLIFGGLEPNSAVNSILFSPASLTGLAVGLRGFNIPGADRILGLPAGTSVPSFGVFVQALQNNNDVNVVSMPHILTSDNQKANIEIGQNLPFPGLLGGGLGGLAGGLGGAAGAVPGLGGGFGGFGTSVQRQDVALKLEITPHVNDGDYVRLEIDNEISDVASENFNGLGPATNKRKVKTEVVVRDQQPVVLGGLVKDRVSESVQKVPLLGDIPILGYLFKYTTRSITKQNLLIIITPYVIKDPADLRRIFERKIQERREFLERYSAFRDDNDYEAHVDFRHKRGLLEEINRTAIETEREAADLRMADLNARGRIIEGAVEPAMPGGADGRGLPGARPPERATLDKDSLPSEAEVFKSVRKGGEPMKSSPPGKTVPASPAP